MPKILAVILAGGKGSRLDGLTEKRAKPALPFGGIYHLIDFPLSNLVHSGLSDVWVIEQYRPHALNEHLSNGRPWDLDRTRGGLQVLPPYESPDDSGAGDEGGFAHGNADALYQHARFIRDFEPELLLVLSSDHLYLMDYRPLIEQHLKTGAELTMVTTETDEDASRFGVVETSKQRVTGFEYKPEEPKSQTVTAEVFLYNAPLLLDTLEHLAAEGEDALKDYGHRLIPEFVERGQTFAYEHKSYWRDLGTIESYHQGHMDLLEDSDSLGLDRADWPLLTATVHCLPARVYKTARIDNSLISPGCTVRGTVRHSVLAPGVTVEEGAVVEDSVLLEDVHIASGARVRRALLDKGTQVAAGVTLGGKGKVTLVGMGARVQQNVKAGESLEPTDEDAASL